MQIYKTDKVAVVLSNNVEQLLKGLASNTTDAVKNAFLNQHGRIIATFDQAKMDEDHFLIVLERPFLDRVREHLDRYLRLNKTSFEVKDWNVYFDLAGDASIAGD